MKHFFISAAAFSMMLGCTSPPPPGVKPGRYSALPSDQLWSIYRTTQSEREMAVVEAELGARGETAWIGDYLGKRTRAQYGLSRYSRSSHTQMASRTADKNCEDFPSTGAAQRYFLAQGGPHLDPHNLDGDGDGLACEWGKTIRLVAARHMKKAQTAYRPRSHSRCYVGPRGGTYTMTSGGRRNYDGC